MDTKHRRHTATFKFRVAPEVTCAPIFAPPVMFVRQARGLGRQARGPQAPA